MTLWTYTVKIIDAKGKPHRLGGQVWTGEHDEPGMLAMDKALDAANRELGPGCKIPHEDKYAVQYHRASDYGMR